MNSWKKQDKGWIGRWFGSYEDVDETESEAETQYERLDNGRSVGYTPFSHLNRRQTRIGDNNDSFMMEAQGLNTYQMSTPGAPGGPRGPAHFDLGMKKKDKKPRVISLWARIKYWFRYSWKMFKTGLLVSGPANLGPMMAPPPMATIVSERTRRQLTTEASAQEVYM